jgi:hypothetical protein
MFMQVIPPPVAPVQPWYCNLFKMGCIATPQTPADSMLALDQALQTQFAPLPQTGIQEPGYASLSGYRGMGDHQHGKCHCGGKCDSCRGMSQGADVSAASWVGFGAIGLGAWFLWSAARRAKT